MSIKQLVVKLWYYFYPVSRLKKSGAQIGKDVFWGEYCYVELENAKFLTIKNNVVVAAHNKFILHDSSLHNVTGFDILYGKIVLENNCYLGANCTILAPTKVGQNTIVGAGSLVKGQLKSDSVYAGNPAKYICSIGELQNKWKKRKRLMVNGLWLMDNG